MQDKSKAVLVIGAGVGGIRASDDLAESGHKVYFTDRGPGIGGTLTQVETWFPDNQCELCKLLPVFDRDECSQYCLRREFFHPKSSSSELQSFALTGEPGNFKVTLDVKSRWMDEKRCTAAALAPGFVPLKLSDEFNRGIQKRKAVYVRNPQAIPNVYSIDQCKMHQMRQMRGSLPHQSNYP